MVVYFCKLDCNIDAEITLRLVGLEKIAIAVLCRSIVITVCVLCILDGRKGRTMVHNDS
jgi:hypothetical protein